MGWGRGEKLVYLFGWRLDNRDGKTSKNEDLPSEPIST